MTVSIPFGPVNPNGANLYTVDVRLQNGDPAPGFITFDQSAKVTIDSPGYGDIETWQLNIIVSDLTSTQTNPFTLTIKNDPPVFLDPPPVRIEANLGMSNSFTFPTIVDPEG